MLFSSPAFFAFFLVYWLFDKKFLFDHHLLLIIVGSTIFYGYWDISYVWLPHFLILVTYGGCKWIQFTDVRELKKKRFIFTIVTLVSPLILIKYTNFIYSDILGFAGKIVNFPMPLGISFVTFSLIAYVTDTYHRRYPLEENFTLLSAYTLFFPHLIAGPILRPAELIPQFKEMRKSPLFKNIVCGFALFTVGLGKKLIFADNIGILVDKVYAGESDLSSWLYLLAFYGFSIQIYCDFSGYTDMAMGVARMLGIKLPRNFDRPYLSQSMIEFWRRWHITLSAWLRDYIYIPLGGNRHGMQKQLANIIITMVIGGLWHGASWTFAIWGLIHGLLIAANHLLIRVRFITFLGNIPQFIKMIITFHCVTFLWIFFRSPDIATVSRILSELFTNGYQNFNLFFSSYCFEILLCILFFILYSLDDYKKVYLFARKNIKGLLWPLLFLIWLVSMTISMGSSAKFVYFDF